MTLTFDSIPAIDIVNMHICVKASDDESEYEFKVMRAALQDHFGMAEFNKTDAINAYGRFREIIETEIQRRYDLGEFEKVGPFNLDTEHFHHLC